uniref:leucine-rich repeat-containing protein 52-like n=1 Tax=Panthera onca TaxID=9690 RepID=UPI00295460F5|nr:leucine-rich repeat-containing protein 52-like [Panthera onca]
MSVGVNTPGGSFSPGCGFSSLEHPEEAKRIPRRPLNTVDPEAGDDQNATCTEPTELAGWPITQVGNPLRYMCITHLDRQDYLFLLLIGFCIFSAGTVAAWLTGMCAVLYQNVRRKSSEDETEDEHGQRGNVSGRIFRSRVDSAQDGFPQLI